MAEEEKTQPYGRRSADRYQHELDTRALEEAAQAMEAVRQVEQRVDRKFERLEASFETKLLSLKGDISGWFMEQARVRSEQHEGAEKRFDTMDQKFNGMQKAAWAIAISLIGGMALLLYNTLTHVH